MKEIAGLKIYTLREISDVLYVTVLTLRGYINSGKLKAVKIGRSFSVTEEDLRAFLLKGTEPKKPGRPAKDRTG